MPESCQVGHNGDQLDRVNRFWHVHLEPGPQSAYAIFDPGVGGQGDGWNISSPLRAELAYVLDQFVPGTGLSDFMNTQWATRRPCRRPVSSACLK